jgi:serine/threonine protein phosphatase PrpC
VIDDRETDDGGGGNGTLATHGVVGKFSWALRSEAGAARETNEDYAGAFVLTSPDDSWDRGPLFVVADGMGGHAAGEVASRVAVERSLATWANDNPGAVPSSIRSVVRSANTAVYDAALEPGKRGMGTTLVVCTLAGREAVIGHIGDSRAYLVRGTECRQVTADHSRVGEMVRMKLLTPEEAAHHPARSQLTRSLGGELGVQIDLSREELQQHDTLVLCTDGLWDALSRADIAHAVAEATGPGAAPSAAVDSLVELALKRDANDNVTALTVHLTSTLPVPAATGRRFFRGSRK